MLGAEEDCLHDSQLLVEDIHFLKAYAAHADSAFSAFALLRVVRALRTREHFAAAARPYVHSIARDAEVVVVLVDLHQVPECVDNAHVLV